MTRHLPQRSFVNSRGEDLAEAVLEVLRAKEGDQFVDDVGTVRKE